VASTEAEDFMEAEVIDDLPPLLPVNRRSGEKVMRTKNMQLGTARTTIAWVLVSAVLLLLVIRYDRPSSAQESEPKTFSSPEQACNALFDAVQKNDEQALESILGGKDISSSSDEVEDRLERERFTQKYQEMHRLVREADGSTVLYIGAENWPFPVPLVSIQGRWYFDSKAGMQEIRFRQVGEDEVTALRICDDFVKAKKQDNTTATGADPTSQYAEELLTAGSTNADNKVRATQENASHPFHGYYFRIVRGNSAAAVGGKNTAAAALVAYPAEYESSGVMTFIVTQDGVVHEKDLGPKTETLAPKMEKHSQLDSTWQAAE
jgi:hypothetical protein